MARTSAAPNQQLEGVNNDAPPPPPLKNPPMYPQQLVGEMRLLKCFKDCNPQTFKGCTDTKEDEDRIREMEKIFKVMRCTKEEKLLLGEFSLKNGAQIWWQSMGCIHAQDQVSITYETFKMEFNKKYNPKVAQDRKAA